MQALKIFRRPAARAVNPTAVSTMATARNPDQTGQFITSAMPSARARSKKVLPKARVAAAMAKLLAAARARSSSVLTSTRASSISSRMSVRMSVRIPRNNERIEVSSESSGSMAERFSKPNAVRR